MPFNQNSGFALKALISCQISRVSHNNITNLAGEQQENFNLGMTQLLSQNFIRVIKSFWTRIIIVPLFFLKTCALWFR